MKKILALLLPILVLIFFIGCKKKAPVEPPEEDLKIATNPAIGSDIVGALANSYSFKLLINSKPPKAGVKIDITVRNDFDNTVSFTQSTQTSTSSISTIDLQIANLVPGNLYTASIDVTSLSKSTNKARIIFKISRK